MDTKEHILPLVTTPYPIPVDSEPPPLPTDAIPSPFVAMTPLTPSPSPLPILNPPAHLRGGYEPPTSTPAPCTPSPHPRNRPNKGKGKAPPYKKKTLVCWTCSEKGHVQKNCVWWSANQGKVEGDEGTCCRAPHAGECPYAHCFCKGCGWRYRHNHDCAVDLVHSQLDYYNGSNDWDYHMMD